MSRFLIGRFQTLEAYVPGEQPREKKYVKLNTNESPFPPSPMVVTAYDREKGAVNRYSDPTGKELKDAVAKVYTKDSLFRGGGKITPEMVSVGNGSDELLAFAILAFYGEEGAAFPSIGYGFYPVFCNLFGIQFDKIPMKDELYVDVKALASSPRNILLANPNAQTGVYIPISDIKTILSANKDRLVLIDEAYCDFGGESAVSLIKDYDNLLVISTLSKSRQLAGGRVGIAMSSKEIIADIEKIRYSFNPYNLDRAAIAAGAAALLDEEYFNRTRGAIIELREELSCELKGLGFMLAPSTANFVLAKPQKISGEELYIALKDKGVLVRYLGGALRDYVRITVGNAQENKGLLEAIIQIFKEKGI